MDRTITSIDKMIALNDAEWNALDEKSKVAKAMEILRKSNEDSSLSVNSSEACRRNPSQCLTTALFLYSDSVAGEIRTYIENIIKEQSAA